VARTRAELEAPLRLRPHDHVGWCYEGRDRFDHVALPYLAEGLERNQLVCYVTDDPSLERLRPLGDVERLLGRGSLFVSSVDEAYGGLRDPRAGAAVIVDFARGANERGFAGVRSAMDVTSAIRRAGLDRWIEWERIADAAIAAHSVVALCAFDRARLDPATVGLLTSVHPAVSGGHGASPFRVFTEDGVVHVCGSVDAFSAPQFAQVLRASPIDEVLVVDVSATEFLNHSALFALHRIAASGVPVVLRHARAVHRYLWELLELPAVDLRFEELGPDLSPVAHGDGSG